MTISNSNLGLKTETYVVNSGLIVQTIASITNGTEIKAVICKIMINCILAASGGAVIIQGKGSVITNHMSESKIIISTFFFVLGLIQYHQFNFYF